MSFKIRNTIALGVVFFVLTLLGVGYWAIIQPRTLKKLTADIKAIDKKLEDLPGLTDEVQRLNAQFQDVKRRYDSRSKEIPQSDMSSQTYGYMSQGIEEAGFLKFDMKFVGTDEKTNWGYNVYKLDKGVAQFENLFKFIYFLENGRRLYKIASMRMEEQEALDPETKETTQSIGFEMELHAYFVRHTPELSTSLAAKALTMIPSPSDPLKPMVTEVLATEAPPNEINIERVDIKAVVPGKAFVLHNNELVVLHLGDKVWRGYVSNILPALSAVEFTLNEGGVPRTVQKRIQFDKRSFKRVP